ncbi:MAG: hypothetical protein RI907_3062 [Pseudomonadota bacterium]|jgi:predicted lipid-binding transport protein (Tim44 family)
MMTRHPVSRILSAAVLSLSAVAVSFTPIDAEAKRLGGGRPAGMQRQMPAKQADTSPPAQQAAPGQAARPNQAAPAAAPATAAAAQAAAQPAKRSWLGPVAGLAAGLGLAALASHFGFGEELANFMMIALLAVAAFALIGWLMRRFAGGGQAAGPKLAGAGAGAPMPAGGLRDVSSSVQPSAQPLAREAQQAFGGGAAPLGAGAAQAVPAGFDTDGFVRVAKMIFIRLQAANDEGNVDDLRKFTTPELFASLRLDMHERGQAKQQTDVMQLDARLVDTAQENGQWVATVQFSGLIREEAEQGAQPFRELWHLVKPAQGDGDWAIAGITPQDA